MMIFIKIQTLNVIKGNVIKDYWIDCAIMHTSLSPLQFVVDSWSHHLGDCVPFGREIQGLEACFSPLLDYIFILFLEFMLHGGLILLDTTTHVTKQS